MLDFFKGNRNCNSCCISYFTSASLFSCGLWFLLSVRQPIVMCLVVCPFFAVYVYLTNKVIVCLFLNSLGSSLWHSQERYRHRCHVCDEAGAHHEVNHPRRHGGYYSHLWPGSSSADCQQHLREGPPLQVSSLDQSSSDIEFVYISHVILYKRYSPGISLNITAQTLVILYYQQSPRGVQILQWISSY